MLSNYWTTLFRSHCQYLELCLASNYISQTQVHSSLPNNMLIPRILSAVGNRTFSSSTSHAWNSAMTRHITRLRSLLRKKNWRLLCSEYHYSNFIVINLQLVDALAYLRLWYFHYFTYLFSELDSCEFHLSTWRISSKQASSYWPISGC